MQLYLPPWFLMGVTASVRRQSTAVAVASEKFCTGATGTKPLGLRCPLASLGISRRSLDFLLGPRPLVLLLLMTVGHPGDAEGGLTIELVQTIDSLLRGLEP